MENRYKHCMRNMYQFDIFLKNITVGDLLAHRAGLPFVDEELTSKDAYSWSRMTSLLAAQKPHWQPGTAHGYHAYTFGYLAGELIRRVDPQHRSCGQFIRDELDREFYLGGTDDEVEARVSPMLRKVVSVLMHENKYDFIYFRLIQVLYVQKV